MAIAAGFQRVYEVGPVFRAEASHTHRHLCEFTGLDLEMEVQDDYHEVIRVLDGLVKRIFAVVTEKCAADIAVIRRQYDQRMPAPVEWTEEPVVVDFRQGCQWLHERGVEQDPAADLSTEAERALGAIVKERFHTDFYILDKFPAAARPFYTMPDAENPSYSNSFDMFVRGEEICSGAQRIHDESVLRERIIAKGVDPATL